jgi:hypothetical protein
MRKPKHCFGIIAGIAGLTFSTLLPAQGPGRPGGPPGGPGGRPLRQHTATEAKPLDLVPATEKASGENQVAIHQEDPSRSISSNAIPDHLVGPFPNRGNPHEIAPQALTFEVTATPEIAAEITPLRLSPFGFAVNGVFFDPGAAEFWQGDRDLGWQYEALGGAVPLGLDENHAHVQPTGTYHYHGLPTLLLKRLGASDSRHSPQIGWAADGFPIYARVGFSDPKNPASPVKVLKSSWRLKAGDRPDGPGGKHDGAFVQDHEYVAGSGDLDECNGRFGVTPEFPKGTYAYFLTDQWPVIPRAFRGAPVRLRAVGPPGGGRQGPRGDRPTNPPGGPAPRGEFPR